MNSSDFQKEKQREIYILRTWRDLTLRGQIQHVRTGTTYPLCDPEVLLALIQEQVALASKSKIIIQSTVKGDRDGQ
ncbi:MAG: hypothetical protein KKD28_06495 [Chloroflexi bacterium]|nr:hypothetical protein [Chloroflexota bacterium]MBU1661105.1 hypothetical protein [Chloroflexota bacterium]